MKRFYAYKLNSSCVKCRRTRDVTWSDQHFGRPSPNLVTCSAGEKDKKLMSHGPVSCLSPVARREGGWALATRLGQAPVALARAHQDDQSSSSAPPSTLAGFRSFAFDAISWPISFQSILISANVLNNSTISWRHWPFSIWDFLNSQ